MTNVIDFNAARSQREEALDEAEMKAWEAERDAYHDSIVKAIAPGMTKAAVILETLQALLVVLGTENAAQLKARKQEIAHTLDMIFFD